MREKRSVFQVRLPVLKIDIRNIVFGPDLNASNVHMSRLVSRHPLESVEHSGVSRKNSLHVGFELKVSFAYAGCHKNELLSQYNRSFQIANFFFLAR